MLRIFSTAALGLSLVFWPTLVPSAFAQSALFPSVRDLQERVSVLEQNVEYLGGQMQAVSAQAASAIGVAAMAAQDNAGGSGAAQADMREMTRQMEAIQFQIDDIWSSLKRLEAFEARLVALENRPIAAPTPGASPEFQRIVPNALPAQPEAPKEPEAPQPRALPDFSDNEVAFEAQATYDNALASLRQGDLTDARTKLDRYLVDFPNAPLIQNAQYWLGETYYAQGDYESSAYYFSEAYKTNNEGNKAPDALLKLSFTLFALNRSEEGCRMLSALSTKHPTAPQNVMDLTFRTMEERGC